MTADMPVKAELSKANRACSPGISDTDPFPIGREFSHRIVLRCAMSFAVRQLLNVLRGLVALSGTGESQNSLVARTPGRRAATAVKRAAKFRSLEAIDAQRRGVQDSRWEYPVPRALGTAQPPFHLAHAYQCEMSVRIMSAETRLRTRKWEGLRSVAPYLRKGCRVQCVLSFDIKPITMMRSGWEKTARRPRITRRWWAPPGIHDEENQQP